MKRHRKDFRMEKMKRFDEFKLHCANSLHIDNFSPENTKFMILYLDLPKIYASFWSEFCKAINHFATSSISYTKVTSKKNLQFDKSIHCILYVRVIFSFLFRLDAIIQNRFCKEHLFLERCKKDEK